MSRDILGEYGHDTPKRQAPRAGSGGVTQAKELPYSEPQGPKGLMHKGIGIGGTNHGNGQCPRADSGGGSPGIGAPAKRSGSQR